MLNKEDEKKYLLEDDLQNKYFERLERIVKDCNKTLRTLFICVSVFISLWIIGYFTVALLRG